MGLVRGNHHLTFAVGPVQEDYDFHTGVLGLHNIKKTVLYDGKTPIYHLYYGNARGDAGTILTSFPFRQAGVMGRRGSNQIKMMTSTNGNSPTIDTPSRMPTNSASPASQPCAIKQGAKVSIMLTQSINSAP